MVGDAVVTTVVGCGVGGGAVVGLVVGVPVVGLVVGFPVAPNAVGLVVGVVVGGVGEAVGGVSEHCKVTPSQTRSPSHPSSLEHLPSPKRHGHDIRRGVRNGSDR